MNRIPVHCAGCRQPIGYRADTNGDGDLVLYVRGCLHCTGLVRSLRPRLVARKAPPSRVATRQNGDGPGRGGHTIPKPKRNDAGELLCIHCDAVIQHRQGRGRPPVYCETHRDPRNRKAAP